MSEPFYLFAYDAYYPSGGMSDMRGQYATLAEAKASMDGQQYDFIEVWQVKDGDFVQVAERDGKEWKDL